MSGYRREPETEEVDEDFVTVARPVDAVEASLLEQALTEDRIPCRVIGTRDAALLGVAQNAMPLRLEVPASRLLAAEEIVEALRHAPPLPEGEGETEEDETERDEEQNAVPASERRKVVLAIGAVMLVFGGSHFYARRPWTAGILAISQLSAVLMTMRGNDFPDRPLGGVAMMTFLFVDAVFGVRASLAFNRGVRPSVARQLVDGVALALLVAALSGFIVLRQT